MLLARTKAHVYDWASPEVGLHNGKIPNNVGVLLLLILQQQHLLVSASFNATVLFPFVAKQSLGTRIMSYAFSQCTHLTLPFLTTVEAMSSTHVVNTIEFVRFFICSALCSSFTIIDLGICVGKKALSR